MAFKLNITDKFMESEHVPQTCLFSGKTECVRPKKMQFTFVPPSAQLGFLVGGLLLMAVLSKRFDLALPTAPRERFKWGLRRNLWILPVFLLPVIFCLVVLPFTSSSDGESAVIAGVIGLVVGIIAAIAGGIWVMLTQVAFKVTEVGEVTVSFPNRMKATYETYRAAVAVFEQERATRRKGRGGSDSANEAEDDDWADTAGASKWDTGGKK